MLCRMCGTHRKTACSSRADNRICRRGATRNAVNLLSSDELRVSRSVGRLVGSIGIVRRVLVLSNVWVENAFAWFDLPGAWNRLEYDMRASRRALRGWIVMGYKQLMSGNGFKEGVVIALIVKLWRHNETQIRVQPAPY